MFYRKKRPRYLEKFLSTRLICLPGHVIEPGKTGEDPTAEEHRQPLHPINAAEKLGGFAKFYAIAVLQGLEVPDRRSIDSRERLRCMVTRDVTGCRRFDLSVLTSDRRVTKDADLGAFIQTEEAAWTGQQLAERRFRALPIGSRTIPSKDRIRSTATALPRARTRRPGASRNPSSGRRAPARSEIALHNTWPDP
jgi:hypothetical protein